MQKMKKQNGITLIALIITIIVMLILVGVSVTVALNGGLFNTAQDATGKTQLESDKEQLLGAVMGGMGPGGKINFDNVKTLPEGFTAHEAEGVKADTTKIYKKEGKEYIVNERGSIGEKEYTIGQEITLKEENFFVIGEDADKVILLAKYNLKADGTQDTAGGNNNCEFSSIRYWRNETDFPLNLNTYPVPAGETSVITTAKTYGEAKGGTGRLMTVEEVEALGGNRNTQSTSGCDEKGYTFVNRTDKGTMTYWLASAETPIYVYVVRNGTYLYSRGWNIDLYEGVRPVVEITKSSI